MQKLDTYFKCVKTLNSLHGNIKFLEKSKVWLLLLFCKIDHKGERLVKNTQKLDHMVYG